MINEGVEKISKQPVVMQEDTLNQLVTVQDYYRTQPSHAPVVKLNTKQNQNSKYGQRT